MIETIRRLLDFQAVAARILCAFGYGVLYSVSVIPVLAIVVALEAVLSPSGGGWFAVTASGRSLGLSVAGKIVFERGPRNAVCSPATICARTRALKWKSSSACRSAISARIASAS
ncbi:MAG: hypothetical protein ACLTTU_10405 [Bilophila wadsworthia]